MKSTRCCISLYLLCFVRTLHAQPAPGDVFREYTWFNKVDECDFSLRVGGRLDYRLTGNAEIQWPGIMVLIKHEEENTKTK